MKRAKIRWRPTRYHSCICLDLSAFLASLQIFSPSLASHAYVGLRNEAYLRIYQQTLNFVWQKYSLTGQSNELLCISISLRRSLDLGKCPRLPQLLLRPKITEQVSLKSLTPNGHLHLIERIFRNVICVKLICLPHNIVHIRLLRFCKQQKLGSADCLEACHSKERRFKHLQSCSL